MTHRFESSAGHQRRLPLGAVMVFVALAAAVAGSVLLYLAAAWRESPVLPVDRWAATLAQEVWSAPLERLMLAATHLGDPITLASIGAAVTVFLLWRREPVLALAWVSALLGNAWLNPWLKAGFMRLRPVSELTNSPAAVGYSFPSGHSSGAMVTYGMLAYLAWRLAPAVWRGPVFALALATILVVGASRVFLQVHFASDVLAGYASGSAWLVLVIAGCAVWRDTVENPRP